MSTDAAVPILNPEAFAIPILDETEASLYMIDALDHVVKDRKGVAVIGPQGAGKSVALATAIEDFRRAEPALAIEQKRKEYQIVEVQSPRAAARRDVIGAIFYEFMGDEQQRRERGGRNKPDDVLLQELVELLVTFNVCAIVMDEAEGLTAEGLLVARDIISRAERLGKEKRYKQGHLLPFGVGILLVGTSKLLSSLKESGELGQRWIRVQNIGLLDPGAAATVYRKYLSAFDRHAQEIGAKAWHDFVRVRVALGADMPIRHIENHVRAYVRRMSAAHPEIHEFDALPYDEEVFFATLNDLPRRAG